MNPFDGKVAIVTGGASGIGRSICRFPAHHGARVIIADRTHAGARGVAAEIAGEGGHATSVGLDVADEGALKTTIASVRLNRGVVLAPRSQHLSWWLHRLFRGFMPSMFAEIIRRMNANA